MKPVIRKKCVLDDVGLGCKSKIEMPSSQNMNAIHEIMRF